MTFMQPLASEVELGNALHFRWCLHRNNHFQVCFTTWK